jgi:hypothetical protein
MGGAVRFVDRVTQTKEWKNEYIRVNGRESHDAIRQNLKGMVRPEPSPSNFVIKAADMLRPFIIYSGLAFNLKAALFQMSNLVPAMGEAGAANVVRGLKLLSKRGLGLVREIESVDPYMKNRVTNVDQDMQTARKQIDPAMREKSIQLGDKEVSLGTVAEVGMMPMKALDSITATAIWIGVYGREISRLSGGKYGKSGVDPQNAYHEQAVEAARNAVKRVVPDFDASSRCQFLRDKGVLRLFNMFSSNAILFAQRKRFHGKAREKGKLSTKGYMRCHLYDFVLQGVACALMFSLVQDGGDDDEAAERYGKPFLKNIADTYSMALPIAGPLISGALFGEGRATGGIRTLFDAPADTASKAATAVGKAVKGGFEEKDMENLGRAALSLASFFAKMPADRIARRAERAGHSL